VPLKIVQNGRYDVPTIVCDHCGKAITDVREGNYQFRHGNGGQLADAGTVYFTHKTCCHAFDVASPGVDGACELDSLFVYLADSLKLDWPKARARAALLDSIG